MGDRVERRIHAWLRRHGVSGLELTPLVRARIADRDRAERVHWLGFAILLLAVPLGYERGATATIVWFIAVYLVLNAAVATAFWLQRRADLRLARELPHRVTRSTAMDIATVLGQGYLWSATVLYGGGILIGTLVAALFADDRALGVAFLAGVVLFAGITAWLLRDIVHRPAVADDEASLHADDRLRRVDASQALAPYTVILAVVAAANGRSAAFWLFLGYAAAGLIAWAVPTVRSARATTSTVSPA